MRWFSEVFTGLLMLAILLASIGLPAYFSYTAAQRCRTERNRWIVGIALFVTSLWIAVALTQPAITALNGGPIEVSDDR